MGSLSCLSHHHSNISVASLFISLDGSLNATLVGQYLPDIYVPRSSAIAAHGTATLDWPQACPVVTRWVFDPWKLFTYHSENWWMCVLHPFCPGCSYSGWRECRACCPHLLGGQTTGVFYLSQAFLELPPHPRYHHHFPPPHQRPGGHTAPTCIRKSTKMCQSMTDFHRVCNVPTVDYSIPEATESPSSPAIYSHSTTKQLVLHILVVNYNTNITQHILIDTIHFW